MCNILKIIEDADAFIQSLKNEVENCSFVPKWNIDTKNHRFEIVCPISHDDQIFLIRNILTNTIFYPSTNIETLKMVIRELEAIDISE